MLKHWKALPSNVRWLVGGVLAAVVLVLVVAWVLFVPTADWLAHHDVGSAQGRLLQAARDAARGRLLTFATGLFAVGALVFTALTFNLSRQGQYTDRFTKAIEQVGSKEVDVRVGGIYALERVARDSRRDHPTVIEVLCAFVREHSNLKLPPPDPATQGLERFGRRDIQAAITVVGRRDVKRDTRPLHLARADLRGTNLRNGNLSGANLTRVHLNDGHLRGAQLRKAQLWDADLTKARLFDADLTGANLSGAKLIRAKLIRARLTGADLTGADLTGADLTGADLTGADVTGANLNGAGLTDAKWPVGVRTPEGWRSETNSRLLTAAGTEPRSAEMNLVQ